MILFFYSSNASKTTRLLWSRTGTPNSVPDSPKSVDSKSTARSRHSVTSSPLRLSKGVPLSAGYDSDDSIRLDRASHSAMKQDIMSIKTMLLKLRRVLNEVLILFLTFTNAPLCALFRHFIAAHILGIRVIYVTRRGSPECERTTYFFCFNFFSFV